MPGKVISAFPRRDQGEICPTSTTITEGVFIAFSGTALEAKSIHCSWWGFYDMAVILAFHCCRYNYGCSSADSKMRLSWVFQVAQYNHRVLKNRRDRQKKRSEYCNVRRVWPPSPTADFEDGERGPQAKECRWPPEARKGRKMNPPLEPPERSKPCQYLDFSPVRPMLDF